MKIRFNIRVAFVILIFFLIISFLFFGNYYEIFQFHVSEQKNAQFHELGEVKIAYPPFYLEFPEFANKEAEHWFFNYNGVEQIFDIVRASIKENQELKEHPKLRMKLLYSEKEIQEKDNKTLESKMKITNQKIGEFPVFKDNENIFLYGNPRHIEGSVRIAKDVMLSTYSDCGWGIELKGINSKSKKRYIAGITVYANIPGGLYFQHFIDAVLPKLVQLQFLKDTHFQQLGITSPLKYTLLLKEEAKHSIVTQLIELLGFEVIYFRSERALHCEYLINICNTPVLHPFLWQTGVSLIHSSLNMTSFYDHIFSIQNHDLDSNSFVVNDKIGYHKHHRLTSVLSVKEKRYVAYMSRSKGTINGGRIVVNENRVIQIIQNHLLNYYPDIEFVEYLHSNFQSISENLSFLSKVKAMIGPHGGALTNIVFTPPDCTLVEFFMINDHGVPPLRHPGLMMYIQSKLLYHPYFILPSKIVARDSDMHVNEDDLTNVLWKIFPPVQ